MLSLLRLERKPKNSLKPFRILIFLFPSYSSGIEMINTFIHSHSSLQKSYPNLEQNGESVYPRVFRRKPRKNPTRWGGTYQYGFYKGVLHPPPTPRFNFNACFGTFCSVWTHAYYLVFITLAFHLSY